MDTELDSYSTQKDKEKQGILETDSSHLENAGFNKISQIWRNVAVMQVSIFILCGASLSLEQLPSSLFTKDGLGTTIFAVMYAVQLVTALFIATPLISILGAKWTLVLAIIGYTVHAAGFFYPTWGVLIPLSIIRGLSSVKLVSRGYYLNIVAHDYARIKGISNDAAASLVFGIAEGVYRISPVWGNLVSSVVLKPANSTSSDNELLHSELSLCGKNFCPEYSSLIPSLQGPPKHQLYTLVGIYTGCMSVAVIIVCFLHQLPSDSKKKISCSRDVWKLKDVLASFMLFKDYRLILLVPLCIYNGMIRTYFLADFSEAFITCPLGSWWIGYIAICYYLINGVGCMILGSLVKLVGRWPIFIFGLISNVAVLITLICFEVTSDKIIIYFALSGMLGLADAVLNVRTAALFGVLFKESGQAGFAILRLLRSLGFCISFAYQSHLCMLTKMYILLSLLTVGLVGYLCVEVIEGRKNTDLKQ